MHFSRSLLLVAFAMMGALGGCAKRADPLTSMQTFFEQVGAGQAQAAWHTAAFGFQAQRSALAFETTAKEMGLTDYVGGTWEKPERDGNTAKIKGSIQTRSGKVLPLIVTLTDESGAWKVYSLRQPPNEATGVSVNRFTLIGKVPSFTDSATQPVPNEQEVRALILENLLRFNKAITAGSFDAFYESVSRRWQDQLTKGQLQRAFQPFIDKGIKLDEIQKLEAVFDSPPSVGTDGLLTVAGSYPTKPYRTNFTIKFIYELPTWKLFGLDVNLVK